MTGVQTCALPICGPIPQSGRPLSSPCHARDPPLLPTCITMHRRSPAKRPRLLDPRGWTTCVIAAKGVEGAVCVCPLSRLISRGRHAGPLAAARCSQRNGLSPNRCCLVVFERFCHCVTISEPRPQMTAYTTLPPAIPTLMAFDAGAAVGRPGRSLRRSLRRAVALYHVGWLGLQAWP